MAAPIASANATAHETNPYVDNSALPVHEHHAHVHTGHNDPALNPVNQHSHEHINHGHLTHPSELAYTTDTKHAHESSMVFEKGSLGSDLPPNHSGSEELGHNETGVAEPKNWHRGYLTRYRWAVHLFIWMFFTGWWISTLVTKIARDQLGWLKPFLLWLAISLRLLTFHVPVTPVFRLIKLVWRNTISRGVQMIPARLRLPLGAFGAFAVIMVGTFATEETADNTLENRAISLFGLAVFIFVFWATSHKRSLINWQAVIVGMLAQFILALFVLRTKAGYDIFNFIAFLASSLLGYAAEGTAFLTSEASMKELGWFVLNVTPSIIFFVAIVQLLYYWGTIQWLIGKFATIFFWGMRISGAEAIVAAASPFVGQGESAMMIKPFIDHLTLAEIHQVMVSGFATIAGSVLAAYIGMGISPVALVSSCVMSIPASIAMSKLRYPETEDTLTSGKVVIPESTEEKPSNSLHAFAMGTWLGLKVGVMIVTGLLCILALLGLLNGLLGWFGRFWGINDPRLSIEMIVGYICYPLAFLLGVDYHNDGKELLLVGRLIGTKIVANEFVAFAALGSEEYAALSPRSVLIATYAVCGFGNISSIGIQIGVLTQLAPRRSGDVAKVAVSALLTGVIATLSSASIAGMLITNPALFQSPGASS
ncbi:h+ nucleoside cotransporter [Phlyctema vagabunda]|uniref:H+ nucleoside cotransporter n=1 Tax=Phlyctema vagabunda TaxID=108571 RepID=A0ABR4PJR0_9HELO